MLPISSRQHLPDLTRHSTPPSFVDAFAGCGGLSLGLKRAGWQGLFAIEKDPFAFATLAANFLGDDDALAYVWPPTLEKQAWDIDDLLSSRRQALTDLAGTVDLLAGGPPCQGFSDAGRRSSDDPRNTLFEAYVDLVRVLRPNLLLLENVRGFSSDFKVADEQTVRNFAVALQDALNGEYDLATAVIHASDFGVPQRRPRFFLVGAARCLSLRDEITSFFRDLESHTEAFLAKRHLPRRATSADAISDLEVRRNGTSPSPDSAGFDAIAYKLPRTLYQRVMRDGYQSDPPDTRLARHRPHVRDRFAAIIGACRSEGRLNVTISAETRKRHRLKKTAIRVLDPLQPAPTITSLPDDLLHYSEPRTLTVRENARLQSFPDWFSFRGNYTTGGHRRRREVPRFTQVANAVPPLLAEQLGLAIFRLLRIATCRNLLLDSAADGPESSSVPPELSPEVTHPLLVNEHFVVSSPD